MQRHISTTHSSPSSLESLPPPSRSWSSKPCCTKTAPPWAPRSFESRSPPRPRCCRIRRIPRSDIPPPRRPERILRPCASVRRFRRWRPRRERIPLCRCRSRWRGGGFRRGAGGWGRRGGRESSRWTCRGRSGGGTCDRGKKEWSSQRRREGDVENGDDSGGGKMPLRPLRRGRTARGGRPSLPCRGLVRIRDRAGKTIRVRFYLSLSIIFIEIPFHHLEKRQKEWKWKRQFPRKFVRHRCRSRTTWSFPWNSVLVVTRLRRDEERPMTTSRSIRDVDRHTFRRPSSTHKSRTKVDMVFKKITDRLLSAGTTATNAVWYGRDQAEKIGRLETMGFSAERARHALNATDGDVDRAAELLLLSVDDETNEIHTNVDTHREEGRHVAAYNDEQMRLAIEESMRIAPPRRLRPVAAHLLWDSARR